MQKCAACKKRFKDGDEVVPILQYVTNEKRGDFVTNQGHKFLHADHMIKFWSPS